MISDAENFLLQDLVYNDAIFYKIELPKGIEPIQQESAYTSPIWYTA